MIFEYRTFSECGPRWKNEDALGCVVMREQRRAMFILCDGMGGHRSGDIASRTVVKSICNYWQGNETHHPEINEFVLSKGDYDGLYNCFNDEEIEHLLERVADIDELHAVFLKRGKDKARDNYSAIIIKITDT